MKRRDFIKTTAVGVSATAVWSLSTNDAKAIEPNDVTRWDYEADVVVVGTGFAGQVSAIIAADNGASVLMIEKSSEKHQGGNSKVCGQGIWCPTEAVFNDAFKYLKAMTAGTGYPVPDEYLWFYVHGSHENKAWFESMGAEMVPNRVPGAWVPFYYWFPGAEGMASETDSYSVGGPYRGQPGRDWFFLEERIKERKAIKKMYETPAKKLVQNPETKEILGVVAMSLWEKYPREIFIKAKRSVVMCAGGYEYNQQMIRDFVHIQDYASTGTPYNTGDGIKMCMAVGADLINMGVYAAPWGLRVRVPNALGSAGFSSPTAGGFILVAADSKRYKNEFWSMPKGPWPNHSPTYCGSVPENGAFRRELTPFPLHAIFDDVAKKSRRVVSGSGFSSQIEGYAPSTDNSEEIANGTIVVADTVADLATKLGRDPAVLQATIDKWNADCAAGKDSEFGRTSSLTPITTAPFYAVTVVPGTLNTQGGMLRDLNMQVIDTAGNPIPRLYAAGEIGDRVWANLYECMKNVGAGCMASGRVAGKNAAAEAPWS